MLETPMSKDALTRGLELFGTKNRDVPLLAMRYHRALCSRVGDCGEVLITAFSWYAEKEEECSPAEDAAYRVHYGDKIAQEVIVEARASTWQPHWWAAEKEQLCGATGNEMLNRVTVTGADNSTPIGWMERTSRKYPWVEWGILLSETSRGGPRFPGREWLDRLSNTPLAEHTEMDFSAHLCGKWVRRAIKGDWGFVEQIGDAWHLFDRVQLNFHGHAHWVDPEPFHESLRQLGKQVIFQVDGRNDHLVSHAYDAGCDVAALYDKSGGAGILPDEWPAPMAGIYTGYAGGLGARNVGEELIKIEKMLVGKDPVWIDAETRLRTSDNSSLNETLVLGYLETASSWIRA